MDMTGKSDDRKRAESTRKGIRKVNLSEIQGSLSKRGRARFSDPVLAEGLVSMLNGELEAFIWEDVVLTGEDDKALNAEKAKWRARAISVFATLKSEHKLTIGWTDMNEMVISLKS